MKIIYIYLIATMKCIAKPVTTGIEDFKKNPNLFYPNWNDTIMKWSEALLDNPIVDLKTGELREMSKYELIKNGKLNLNDGEYLNEGNKTIVFVEKPNDWSIWSKVNSKWEEDINLKNKKKEELKNLVLNKLLIAKNNFINQKIEIEKNGKKYIFTNNVNDRNNLFVKLQLMNILNQNSIEKLKVINSLGNIEFISLDINDIKKLMNKIQDIIEVADVNEQTALTGMDRYSIEQLQRLDVNEFFVL